MLRHVHFRIPGFAGRWWDVLHPVTPEGEDEQGVLVNLVTHEMVHI